MSQRKTTKKKKKTARKDAVAFTRSPLGYLLIAPGAKHIGEIIALFFLFFFSCNNVNFELDKKKKKTRPHYGTSITRLILNDTEINPVQFLIEPNCEATTYLILEKRHAYQLIL